MNPSSSAVEETKSTLKFAQRVKKVMLKAKVNEVVDDKALIHKYRSHVSYLLPYRNARSKAGFELIVVFADVRLDSTTRSSINYRYGYCTFYS